MVGKSDITKLLLDLNLSKICYYEINYQDWAFVYNNLRIVHKLSIDVMFFDTNNQ